MKKYTSPQIESILFVSALDIMNTSGLSHELTGMGEDWDCSGLGKNT